MEKTRVYTQTNVRLPRTTAAALKKRAVEEGRSLAEIIRELSEQYLAGGGLFGEVRKRDRIWNLPNRAVKTGQKDLAGRIDDILYGGKN